MRCDAADRPTLEPGRTGLSRRGVRCRSPRGSRYSRSRWRPPSTRAPQWRHTATHPRCPDSSVPIRVPRPTRLPTGTSARTGSYVVRSPPGWSMETTGLSATVPAKMTIPAPAASTACPSAPARSTPRCPGSQFCAGLSKCRTTAGRGCRGQSNRPSGRAVAVGAAATIAAMPRASAEEDRRRIAFDLVIRAAPRGPTTTRTGVRAVRTGRYRRRNSSHAGRPYRHRVRLAGRAAARDAAGRTETAGRRSPCRPRARVSRQASRPRPAARSLCRARRTAEEEGLSRWRSVSWLNPSAVPASPRARSVEWG